MSTQIPKESAPAIVVFYAGNSLMHQVSNWAIRHPSYDFALCFAQSLHEIQSVLRRTAITIVDASEDPTQAMAAFVQATIVLDAGRVAVYTETMYEGLELFVRVRGAPLLLGPMSDAPWDDLLAKMLQSAPGIGAFGSPGHRKIKMHGGLRKTWLRKYRLQNWLTQRLPTSDFPERR